MDDSMSVATGKPGPDDLHPWEEPFAKAAAWLAEAEKSEINDPNAMALASVGADGMPSVRMVLLKAIDPRGFVFYTNFESRKGRQILETRKAALVLHWKSLRRQVRVEGEVEIVSDAEADDYYHSRPRASQIGAWASQQSRPLESRFELEKRIAAFTAKYAIGTVPRPEYWSGFRIRPTYFEFWEDRPFRLHDRLVYSPDGDRWRTEKLFP
ncbi:pyridoxamine 5'-phosphate oxidase [Dongia mobilis]|uniref:Pyridoxine/pyridoxamine 5'-phosphate oxidase n=1 Tax=Dongia mobilis TaxID=578943 RepID=A0A4V3DDW8_9PROT|nr:pyridoxamine 5'-phosphate oxidase [Dongia mobilis]